VRKNASQAKLRFTAPRTSTRSRAHLVRNSRGGLASSSRRLGIGRQCGDHRATRSPGQRASTAAAFPAANVRRCSTKLNLLKLIGADSNAQSLLRPMTDHCLRSSYESDNVPGSKAVARRAIRNTLGPKLEALYQVPQDLPEGILMALDAITKT
jgi:hypothetical protein